MVGVIVGGVAGAGLGALVDWGVDKFVPATVPDGAKIAGKGVLALLAAFLGAKKHPAAAAGAAAGLLASDARFVAQKILPAPTPSPQQLAAIYGGYSAQLGAVGPYADIGAVGQYADGYPVR